VSLGKQAQELARRDLSVFPCKPRGKEPACANGCKDASTDPALIAHWWQQDPNYNIGIATGERSHCFVVDIDGPDAEAELKKLEAEYGALPLTVESITPRPGRHLFFDWPRQSVRNSAGKIAPRIDVRGEGGYVLAPPSIHPSGRPYHWSVDSGDTFAPAPAWLLNKITTNGHRNGTPPAEWRTLVHNGVAEGQRNASIARLTGYLLRRQIDPTVALEFLLAWNEARCRPPLPESEVIGIVDSIAGAELRRRGNGGAT
jgi:hypothetical protein